MTTTTIIIIGEKAKIFIRWLPSKYPNNHFIIVKMKWIEIVLKNLSKTLSVYPFYSLIIEWTRVVEKLATTTTIIIIFSQFSLFLPFLLLKWQPPPSTSTSSSDCVQHNTHARSGNLDFYSFLLLLFNQFFFMAKKCPIQFMRIRLLFLIDK